MSNRQPRQLPFVPRVMHALSARFAKWGHNPSPSNLRALEEIAGTIEKMAAGTAERATYLSWAAPGTGKTEAIVESISQLVRDPHYQDCGIIIFLAQRTQVERLAADLLASGLSEDDLSVLVGTKSENDELRQRGRGHFDSKGRWVSEHQKARVVLATQAKLLSVVAFRKGKRAKTSLDNIWFYEGKPRRVRIWDETILPAETQVLHEPKIGAVVDLLRGAGFTKQADILERWRLSLVAGEPTEVPAFDSGLDGKAMARLLTAGTFEEASPLIALLALQWQGLAVMRDYDGNAILHYAEVLPDDFTPLLVTDASGKLRILYKLWDAGRGRVIPLHSGEKRFDRLIIKHWDHASGREAHNRKIDRFSLINAAASVFRHIPENEHVLFIVRKPAKPHQNMEKWVEPWKGKTGSKGEKVPGIRDLLTPEQNARAHFLTWGLHTATNDYRHCKHVVLVGVLQTAKSITAANMKAAGQMSVEDTLDEKQIRNGHVREGGHNILQGANRGALRKLEWDQCPAGCTLWTIFSSGGQMGLPSDWLFKECFPGAKVDDWEPMGLQMRTGRLKTDNRVRLAEALVRRLGAAQTLSFELRDLEPEFTHAMAFRFLSKEVVVRDYLRESYGLALAAGPALKRGRVKVATFVLERQAGGV